MRHLQHVHKHDCLLLWRTPPLGIHLAEAVFNQVYFLTVMEISNLSLNPDLLE
jgi:hypothetical protein